MHEGIHRRRGAEIGQHDEQCTSTLPCSEVGEGRAVGRLDQFRLQGVQHRGGACDLVTAACRCERAGDRAGVGRQAGAVPDLAGSGQQRHRRIHPVVESRHAVHHGRRSTTVLEQHLHSAVALHPIGPHDGVSEPCGRAPVDAADVIAVPVLAQVVELGPPAERRGDAVAGVAKAVELEAQQRCVPRREGRVHLERSGDTTRGLSRPESERAGDPNDDLVEVERAAPPGLHLGADGRPTVHRQDRTEPAHPGPERRRQGIGDPDPQRPPRRGTERPDQFPLLPQHEHARQLAVHADPPRRRREVGVDERDPDHRCCQQEPDRAREEGRGDHDGTEQARAEHGRSRQPPGPPGPAEPDGCRCGHRPAGCRCLRREDHRGTGTDASTRSRTPSGVAPSSAASGRSRRRWRSAGRATALTSSGLR